MPDPSPSTLTVLNSNFLQLGRRSGGPATADSLPQAVYLTTVKHTALVGIEPTTFRSWVRRATSCATETTIRTVCDYPEMTIDKQHASLRSRCSLEWARDWWTATRTVGRLAVVRCGWSRHRRHSLNSSESSRRSSCQSSASSRRSAWHRTLASLVEYG